MNYTVLLSHEIDPDVVVATVPTLDVVTQAATIELALAAAREAVELDIEGRLEDGQDVPLERPESFFVASLQINPAIAALVSQGDPIRR